MEIKLSERMAAIASEMRLKPPLKGVKYDHYRLEVNISGGSLRIAISTGEITAFADYGEMYFYYVDGNRGRRKYITQVENMFKDPLGATKEEAELFKLEHGFDYPKELMGVNER